MIKPISNPKCTCQQTKVNALEYRFYKIWQQKRFRNVIRNYDLKYHRALAKAAVEILTGKKA